MSAHILIIEDNEMSLALAEYLLRQSGYIVSSATDGDSGLCRALENEADLILCDLDLPVLDGPQLVRALRANGRWRAVPVLAFTAGLMTEEQNKALKQFDACISKPIDPASFTATVAHHLAAKLRASHG